MKPETNRIYYLTAWIAFIGLVFCLFFQVNKTGPFRDINPFGVDPYDAVGSFAVQAVFLLGILTFSRAVRVSGEPGQGAKTALIYRGNALMLVAMLLTLLSDWIAVFLHPLSPSFWSNLIQSELAVMSVFVLAGIIALWVVFRGANTTPPPRNLTPADGIDDLWVLVRMPVLKVRNFLPSALVGWIAEFSSDRVFNQIPWINPRLHPWRFACGLGLLVGVAVLLAQLLEGLPPSLQIGLLLAGIFISAELLATLAGFALLGGYLGLRPPIHVK